ncbi:hypothetical protein CPB85DRAFT_1518846 [Mucidula mucida]|nr:hypothetical protein CPB85DRAFT_1518846 [Mucidula mucida]
MTSTLEITPKERFCVDIFDRLIEAGYYLCPCFHPKWKPSAVKYAWEIKSAAQSWHNRTVPILDKLEIDGTTIFVLPLLREFDDPPFLRRSECPCLEAICQILQGLKFMHENEIAHKRIKYCTRANIHRENLLHIERVRQDKMPPEFLEPVIPLYQAFKLNIYQIAWALILFESLVSELDANTLWMNYIVQNPDQIECVTVDVLHRTINDSEALSVSSDD